MDSIDLLMDEHQYILRMLAVVRSVCYGILDGQEVNYEDFDKIIDFIRNYADAHHHGKEEKLLFNEMTKHLGGVADKLINHGMLVEHDLGRLYIQELSEALDRVKSGDDSSRLDVIANAVGYTSLLKRHIEKEDSVVYTFARRQLSPELLEKVDWESQEFEEAADQKGTPRYYRELVVALEQKYQ